MSEHEIAVIEWALEYARLQNAINNGVPFYEHRRRAQQHLLEACGELEGEHEGRYRPPHANGADLARFHNALRVLFNIDRAEFVEAGLDAERWPDFRANPHGYFIRASQGEAQKLWSLIEERQS